MCPPHLHHTCCRRRDTERRKEGINTGKNVRHWYERPLRKWRRAPPPPPAAQVTPPKGGLSLFWVVTSSPHNPDPCRHADAASVRSFVHSVVNSRRTPQRAPPPPLISPPRGPLTEVGDVVEVPEAVLVFARERAGLARRRERRRLGGELLVEVADVFFAADGGDEGGGHLPLQQRLPVHVLEEEEEEEHTIIIKFSL